MYRRVRKALDPTKYNIISGSKRPPGTWNNFKEGRDELSEGATVWVGPRKGHYYKTGTGEIINNQPEMQTQVPEEPKIQTPPSLESQQQLEQEIEAWKAQEPQKVNKPFLPAYPAYGGVIAQMVKDADGDFKKFAKLLRSTTLVVIDYETTGIGDAGNWPTQFGAVKVKNGKILDRFNAYMNPEDNLGEWAKANLKRVNESGELEGLTDEWLSGQSSMKDAHEKILQFIGNHPIVAQNSRFDLDVFNRVRRTTGFKYKRTGFLDTLSLARDLVQKSDLVDPQTERPLNPKVTSNTPYGLANLAYRFGIDLDNAHSADEDAEATAKLVYKLLDYGSKNGPVNPLFMSPTPYWRKFRSKLEDFRKKRKESKQYEAAMIEWRSKDPTLKKSKEGQMLSLCFQMAAEALRYGKYR